MEKHYALVFTLDGKEMYTEWQSVFRLPKSNELETYITSGIRYTE